MSISWTGLTQCQRCQKTAELRVVEAIPELGGGPLRSVLVTFERPDGWPRWEFCSRRCELQAEITRARDDVARLEQALEEEHGEPS